MKNAMQKDFWREIQHTRSRFFSIMILVALSVAFLSGLKATAPDMKKTGDDYLDSLHSGGHSSAFNARPDRR